MHDSYESRDRRRKTSGRNRNKASSEQRANYTRVRVYAGLYLRYVAYRLGVSLRRKNRRARRVKQGEKKTEYHEIISRSFRPRESCCVRSKVDSHKTAPKLRASKRANGNVVLLGSRKAEPTRSNESVFVYGCTELCRGATIPDNVVLLSRFAVRV